MSYQPPYGSPGGGYPPPGGYPPGGYPPPPLPPAGKTKLLDLDHKLASALCYIPTCCCLLNVLACILWIATEPKESRLVRFHAIQGLMLAGVYLLIEIIFRVVGGVLGMSPSIGTGGEIAVGLAALVVTGVYFLILLALLAVHIFGAVKASQGQIWKLPLLGDIAEKNS